MLERNKRHTISKRWNLNIFFISNEMSKETKILTVFSKGPASCPTESYAVNDWLKISSCCFMKMNKVDLAKRHLSYSHFYLQKFEVFEETHSQKVVHARSSKYF